MKRPLLLCIAALALGACQDRPDATGPIRGPSAAIVDGAHSGGNPNFFFLPPMVADPSGDPNFDEGGFNAVLSPTVTICLLDGATNDCAAPQLNGFPIVFTKTTGPGSETIRVNETDEYYIVNWHIDQFELSTDAQYRIRVTGAAADQEWGVADVQPVSSGKELKNLDSGELIGLVDGRTLPIKFRPEFGVYTFGCFNNDCTEQVIGSGGGTVVTPTVFAGVDIPAGALDNDVTIIISRINTSERPCLPTHLRQFEGCYFYDTDPALSEVQNSGEHRFNVDVTVGICRDPEGFDDRQFQLAKFDLENADQGVVLLEEARADFVSCDGFNGSNDLVSAFGRVRHYAGAGWRAFQRAVGPWFSPPPLHAGDEGPGGTTGSFTDIGWVLAADMTLDGGDGQPAVTGTSVPLPIAVRVTAQHPEPDPDDPEAVPEPVAGLPVTFTVTGGGGSVGSATVTTGPDGIAATSWTLGLTRGDQTVTATAAAFGGPILFTARGIELLGSVVDPIGDNSTDERIEVNPDLVVATVEAAAGQLTLRVRFAEGTFDANVSSATFSLDTDQNHQTGHPGVAASGTLDNDVIGVEFIVTMGSTCRAGMASLFRHLGGVNQFGPVAQAEITVLESENGYDVSFPFALIEDDGVLNFKVTASGEIGDCGFTGILDVLPDIGSPPGGVEEVIEGPGE